MAKWSLSGNLRVKSARTRQQSGKELIVINGSSFYTFGLYLFSWIPVLTVLTSFPVNRDCWRGEDDK